MMRLCVLPLPLALLALILSLDACDGVSGPQCGDPGVFCAWGPPVTLVVTGQVRASANPLADVTVSLTAYSDSCGGSEIVLLPSPNSARTDSIGIYVARAEVTQSVSNACVRIAYSDALHTDTSGVTLHARRATPDTLHLDITAP
jgi:hypothetical protein